MFQIDQTYVLSLAKPLHLLMCCAAANSSFSKEVLVISLPMLAGRDKPFHFTSCTFQSSSLSFLPNLPVLLVLEQTESRPPPLPFSFPC